MIIMNSDWPTDALRNNLTVEEKIRYEIPLSQRDLDELLEQRISPVETSTHRINTLPLLHPAEIIPKEMYAICTRSSTGELVGYTHGPTESLDSLLDEKPDGFYIGMADSPCIVNLDDHDRIEFVWDVINEKWIRMV